MDLLLVDLKQKQPGLGKHVEVVEGPVGNWAMGWVLQIHVVGVSAWIHY